MLIPNHLPTLRSCTPPLPPQVFRIHRPIIKVKHRSFVPTASNLLVKQKHSIEIIDHEILNVHSMEEHSRTHEIPERPTGLDSFMKANSENHASYSTCSCIRSHRTEDILVREDEDGIRSHFCPLSRELDGVRDENEDYPDQPMKLDFDVDLIFKNCSLKSEEIPCLMAEKPTLSECEDMNMSSDVDATTSMIYGLSQNRRPIEDSVTLEYLYKHKTKYFSSHRKLDEKTMSSWIEESSDDTENYSSDREMQAACKAGDESDMEEFEEIPAKENDTKISRCRSDQEDDDEIYNDASKRNEIPNTVINKTENTVEYSNMIGIQNTDFEKGLREISSELENSDENKLHGDDISKQTFESGKRPELTCGQGENNNSLKTEVDTKHPNPTRRCASVQDKILENHSTGSSEIKPPADTKAIEICLSEDSKSNKTDGAPPSNTDVSNGVRDSSKTEENEPESKMESKVQKSQEFDVRKVDKRDNFAMEPVDMRSPGISRDEEAQPDLATALRFMTEIYPTTKDDDDFYSDTLSTKDLPSEMPNAEKSADSLIFQDIQLEQTTGIPVDAPSHSKSKSFEPVLAENKGVECAQPDHKWRCCRKADEMPRLYDTGKRSRNKFSKFFKSFKKKLAKKE